MKTSIGGGGEEGITKHVRSGLNSAFIYLKCLQRTQIEGESEAASFVWNEGLYRAFMRKNVVSRILLFHLCIGCILDLLVEFGCGRTGAMILLYMCENFSYVTEHMKLLCIESDYWFVKVITVYSDWQWALWQQL